MNTPIQHNARISPFSNTSVAPKGDSAAGKAQKLQRTDSAHMDTVDAPSKSKSTQPSKARAERTQHGPRGGKNDSAYEGPKPGSLTHLQRQKIAFLVRQGEHELSSLDKQLTHAMERATASGYRDGVAVARRDALALNKGQVAHRLHSLRALLAGDTLPALVDAMSIAKAATDLAGPQAGQARARYNVALAAVAQHEAGK